MSAGMIQGTFYTDWTGGFWKDRWDVCRNKMVPHMWEILKDNKVSHCWQNFLIAAGEAQGEHSGPPFHDGDFYKWLEAAARVYGNSADRFWLDQLDYMIGVIAKVQREDGYIFTLDAINKRNKGFSEALVNDLNFEVYNMGHLMSAGTVHFTVTGKNDLLDVAEKAASYLVAQFSSLEEATPRTAICPSHYMGLAQLHKITGKQKYLDLLEKLIVIRDRVPNGKDDNQDRLHLKKHREIVGHVVRANYLYAGLSDLYLEKADSDYRRVLESVWSDLVSKKLYITGGCGALYDGVSPYGSDDHNYIQRTHQSYGRAYELPNTAGYNETCASVGFYLWNYRMSMAFGESKYADYMERSLYNGILSGINLGGDRYFYTNALRCLDHSPYSLKWSRHRESYITSFCCPPNVVRTIAEKPDTICISRNNGVAFLMYGDCRVGFHVTNGAAVEFKMNSTYPWDGEIELIVEKIEDDYSFPVYLRIPDWADSFTLAVNGDPLAGELPMSDGFVALDHPWKIGDRIHLSLPMNISFVESHPMVEETRNHVAVTRGPLVYCLETVDLPAHCDISHMYIDPKTIFSCEKSVIGSTEINVLKGDLWYWKSPEWADGKLYRARGAQKYEKVAATLIPYFAWDNRKRGEMTVWLPLLPQH